MNKELFKKNRKKILDQMEDNSIFVIFSRPNNDEDIHNQKYNVDRNYFYVSGLFEYENIVVLTKINNMTTEMIFIKPYDEFEAKWVGAPLSKEEVTEKSGIVDVRYLENFDNNLERLLSYCKNIYLDFIPIKIKDNLDENRLFAKKIKDNMPWLNIINGRKLFSIARTVKSNEEIEEIEKAVEITNKGIQNILKHMGSMYEYQLESYFDQAIKYYGATGYAFPTIAASGKNATCLHYQDNNGVAHNGDLILFDLGCSLNMYCSDISRTFPVSGKFSERQKQLYDIVLKGQQIVFENAKPGITTKELNQILIKYYEKTLMKIGLIKKPEDVSKYYYHGVSHHIGLDCHDLCEYDALRPGSIISNEPGLYIEEEGIGIRIEDDVLITENGARWLSPQIIKTTEEIEEFIERNRK